MCAGCGSSRLPITTFERTQAVLRIALEGAARVTLTDISKDADGGAQNGASATIYVCNTCRRPDDPEDYPRPGAALAAATILAANDSGVAVQQLRCLANCKRGCTAVLRRSDPSVPSWTYVFGHLDATTDAQALVQGAQLLARSADGLMPWKGRPEALKRGLIARVPPFSFSEHSE
jgi:predicted metal-binding protein